MPPVVVKSYYLCVVEALSKCNFITLNNIHVKRVVKDDTVVKLFTEDEDTGEEFITSFDYKTQLTIVDNTVGFESNEGEDMTLRFFTQSKYFP